MLGTVCFEREVEVAANEAWKLLGSLRLARIVVERLPNFISKIEVEGDGGAGTNLLLIFPTGTLGLTSYKETFIVVDDKKRVKEVEVVEGGVSDLGFTLKRFRLEVVEKEGLKNMCFIKSTIEFEMKEERAANIPLVSINFMFAIMELAVDYLLQNCNED